MDRFLVIILGPTASGKTELAIKVAGWLKTEIISADSRQFYRELNIGTAKPSAAQLEEIRHHFIGHISITESYNVSRYEKEALLLLETLFPEHECVVMAGGSGLYIDAVCRGMDEQPENDPAVRQNLKSQFMARGIEYLRNELLRLDPEYYGQVDLSNPHRLMRAIEVCLITGKPYSSYRKGHHKVRPFRIIKFGIDIPRDELNLRINTRVDEMIAGGLVAEAGEFYSCRHLVALNTVGYNELFGYFEGKTSLEEAIEKIKINTRQYAKRQMTWFRRDPEIRWIRPGSLTPVILREALDG